MKRFLRAALERRHNRDAAATDGYTQAWDRFRASGPGLWACGMQLTNRTETAHTIDYQLQRPSAVEHLAWRQHIIAEALRVPAGRVIVDREPNARLTILTSNPVTDVRYCRGPRVANGVIEGVGRLIDGRGEANVTMWDRYGTVPTVLAGPVSSGKTEAVKVLACGALAGGVLNLLYADSGAHRRHALAAHARVAIIGQRNIDKLPALLATLMDNRRKAAPDLTPNAAVPGWMFVHEAYNNIHAERAIRDAWATVIGRTGMHGIWPVAASTNLYVPEWTTPNSRRMKTPASPTTMRSPFALTDSLCSPAQQLIAFGPENLRRGGDTPHLLFDPAHLPTDDRGQHIPGIGVHNELGTPVRWDYLPSTTAAQRIIDAGASDLDVTDEMAFRSLFNTPAVHPADVEVLEAWLGPAVNGRWRVGGPEATHQFRA